MKIVGMVDDQAATKKMHDPGNPMADKDGFVYGSNVNEVTEMVEMMGAARSYQNNSTGWRMARHGKPWHCPACAMRARSVAAETRELTRVTQCRSLSMVKVSNCMGFPPSLT